MILQSSDYIREFYKNGHSYDHYAENMTKGFDRFEMATESINEYVEELHLDDLNHPFRFLVIAQLDCTDCAVALPAFATLAKRFSNWDFRIVYKDEINEVVPFKDYFKVGSKQTTPQILIFNQDLEYITRWFDKSVIKKKILKKYTDKGYKGDFRKQKISETPELNHRFESKSIVNELLYLLRKAKYYL